MKNILFVFCLAFISFSYSQATKKTVSALRITKSPTIDGILNEAFWEKAQEAKDFVMFEPGDGGNEREDKKTTVKIVYDNEAIYFGATMYDANPKEIPMQFGGRDQFGTVDFFLISINPNNDGQNDTEFVVMSTGAQGDAKVSSGREDFSWNAVWDSNVKVNKDSWVVEIKIPYSALRFSNTNIQTWGINFHRRVNNLNEQYVWNYIDKKVGEITQYSGEIIGIKDIKPPTRLSFSPYASSSYTTFDGDSEFNNSIGMDLKYGINESFTLDATLIPDFGQTAFDDQVLNLGPFEQRYEEKRAFFTEGTELFNKGGLFYSRRVGNAPVNYNVIEEGLNENEEVISNPDKVNMLNAIKISGRTKKGLGIGVFNAITEKTSATIRDNATSETRKKVTEPLANYNLLVLDQQFNQNSSVSLVNSNVLRSGDFRDANVTALLFDISDKQNKFNIMGNYKLSNVNEFGVNTNGYSTFIEVGKRSGNIQYEIGHWRVNDTYDIKDLGFQSRNNLANYFSKISYQIFEPTKTLSGFRITFQNEFRYQNNPNKYSGNNFEINARLITLNRLAYGGQIESSIGNQYDFYEPRVAGRFFKENARIFTSGWISTDYRKKFAMDLRAFYFKKYNDSNKTYSVNFSPRFRFSDKFEVIYAINFREATDEKGYVNELDNGAIIFGNRASKTVTNTLSSKLSFSTKSSLALSFRHYWSPVTYDTTFFELNSDGNLNNSSYSDNHDINYNIWNFDLSYSWEFAPGSQLVALYRNSIFNEDDLSSLRFKENIDNLFKEPVTNNISLKLIYYLDYNNLKTWL
ncbi:MULTISPECIES: DUF5916 domain-containing protein [Flavobacteriaceae]|uniref:Uncharacterized protein n=2 Tax=Flavobacteriaceae TaxID=49546 RepID=A0A4Y8AWN4_9FLAO|nr:MULTISPECIES: DUF5916 domain-containing protein [Flavobacteriaceae]TEW76946.1 hypothetical protein E2488_03610 [Gramella jeungdoensis]GGK59110.1 hypothetical protein GCM10007963_29080 [Lutibacter litoralis]